jgi:hypothetical protein
VDVILERCAGLDVHQATITACIRCPGPAGERTQVIQTFGAATSDLLALWDCLAAGFQYTPVLSIASLSLQIGARLAPLAAEVTRVQTAPGVKQMSVENIVAEIGVDMVRFPTPGNLANWASLCPGNNESVGKRRRGRTRKGNRWLKITLIEAALAATRAKGFALAARSRRICRHGGHKIAIVAVAHAILEIVWHLLAQGTTYHDLGADYIDRRDKEQATRHYVRLLEKRGRRVTLEPAPIAA